MKHVRAVRECRHGGTSRSSRTSLDVLTRFPVQSIATTPQPTPPPPNHTTPPPNHPPPPQIPPPHPHPPTPPPPPPNRGLGGGWVGGGGGAPACSFVPGGLGRGARSWSGLGRRSRCRSWTSPNDGDPAAGRRAGALGPGTEGGGVRLRETIPQSGCTLLGGQRRRPDAPGAMTLCPLATDGRRAP